jgi:hypothetical protein
MKFEPAQLVMGALEALSDSATRARDEIHDTGGLDEQTFAAVLMSFERMFYAAQRLVVLSRPPLDLEAPLNPEAAAGSDPKPEPKPKPNRQRQDGGGFRYQLDGG